MTNLPDAHLNLKKILIIGAECTGKSTLAQTLATIFDGVYVSEYMRTYLAQKPDGYLCQYDDLIPIAQGQIRQEQLASHQGKPYLFCDTSLLLLQVYSEHYFGRCPQWIVNKIKELHYDLILLTDNRGVVWQADGQRDLPDGHDMIYQAILTQLASRHLPYVAISGTPDERLAQVRQCLLGDV